ncbi:MAG: GxxExxY protein [Candidatus Doudnabacteria bacterium]|nr:GxxExxY protein [Candidatus Doudnabacteria bacterium]
MSQETKSKLLYGELSYQINGLLFAVHNEIGQFGKEKQYADLFEKKLKEKNIEYKRELIVGDSGNIFDFLISESVLVELKSKPFLLNTDYDQVKRYLQSCDLELGILVNFRSKYLIPKRIIRKRPNL